MIGSNVTEPTPTEHCSASTGALVVLPFLDGRRTVVVLAGHADGATAARLHDQLIRSVAWTTRSLVVDLTDLTVGDAQGVEALHGAVREAEGRGVAVSLRGQSPDLRQQLGSHGHLGP